MTQNNTDGVISGNFTKEETSPNTKAISDSNKAITFKKDAVSCASILNKMANQQNQDVAIETLGQLKNGDLNSSEEIQEEINKAMGRNNGDQNPSMSSRQNINDKLFQHITATKAEKTMVSENTTPDSINRSPSHIIEKSKKEINNNIQNTEFNSVLLERQGNERTPIKENIQPSQLVHQVGNEIKEIFNSDGGRVKITLTPPSLGTLEMDVAVRNDKVEVILIASSKDVQQTLNMNIDHLRGTLQNQGLTIDRCDVLMQTNHEDYHQNTSQQTFYREGSEQNNRSMTNEELLEKIIPGQKSVLQHLLSFGSNNISIFA
jgi:flagellar hook-length control protein FliK